MSSVATTSERLPAGGRGGTEPGGKKDASSRDGNADLDRAAERAGWGFVAPAVGLLVLFLALPIGMALWVSLTDWRGRGSPFSGDVGFVGMDNYAQLFTTDGLIRQDFMTSLRNTAYYVAMVVPLQTGLALFLAIVLNSNLRGRTFFRTAFYFPAVTSSVAVSLIFIFLFTSNGAINGVLRVVGIDGPTWFADARGLLHLIGDGLGLWDLSSPPEAFTDHGLAGLSWWEWMSGPSVALTAIVILVVWTTTGTFMLMYLAALQNVPGDVEEAAMMDGANRYQRFRYVTVPLLKPTTFLVVTLGLIGTWQVFDQIYLLGQGAPSKTTLSPAFLSYQAAFQQAQWGPAAAMAFVLFGIILVLTGLQRFVMRDKDAAQEKKAERRDKKARQTRAAAVTSARATSSGGTP